MNKTILRQYAVGRTFFAPTDILSAVQQLGFVQIDPIRAPACTQDLILRHRVPHYIKGDIERTYPELPLEEVFFINHGIVPRTLAHSLWSNKPMSDFLQKHVHEIKMARALLGQNGVLQSQAFNRELGKRSVNNGWGVQSQAGTQILQRMHSAGLLRIARREKGQRLYAQPVAYESVDPLVLVEQALMTMAQTYAPFNHRSLVYMARLLLVARPDIKELIKNALERAQDYLASCIVDDMRWYWSHAEQPHAFINKTDTVRLLTPFDPLVWDRDRFAYFWGWTYRFEAYKPEPQRQFGYYAMPLLWRDDCVGWGNVAVRDNVMYVTLGYAKTRPSSQIYQKALSKELDRLNVFLQCDGWVLL